MRTVGESVGDIDRRLATAVHDDPQVSDRRRIGLQYLIRSDSRHVTDVDIDDRLTSGAENNGIKPFADNTAVTANPFDPPTFPTPFDRSDPLPQRDMVEQSEVFGEIL
ncbi:MAG: hypothetical protein AAF532_03280 [Planctomycetota bacterium]